MKKIFVLLLVLFLGTAACESENNQTVDGDQPGAEPGDTPEPEPGPAPTFAFFADADGDGFGDPGNRVEAETAPAGFVDNEGDCDDGNISIHPGAKDPARDGIDQDCDGFFQWLPAEGRSGRLLATWTVDTSAGEADNEVHVDDPAGLLFLGSLYHYDASGHVTRLEHTSARGPETSFEDYVRDEEGHVVEFRRGRFVDDPAASTLTEVNRFVYADGRKISAKVFRGDPASVPVHRSGRWTYDAQGHATHFELFSGDFEAGGSLAYADDYTYDANGFLNGLIRRDGTGAIGFGTVLTNDEEGRPLTYKRFNGDPANPATTVPDSRILEYDGGGLALYLDFSGDFDDPAATLAQMYALSNDDAGNRVGLRFFRFAESAGPLAIVEWTYDEHGNVLSVAVPLDDRIDVFEIIVDEDPSLPVEPAVPTEDTTFSNYFLAPFDIVDVEGVPGLP